jgi:hypothetical protein
VRQVLQAGGGRGEEVLSVAMEGRGVAAKFVTIIIIIIPTITIITLFTIIIIIMSQPWPYRVSCGRYCKLEGDAEKKFFLSRWKAAGSQPNSSPS